MSIVFILFIVLHVLALAYFLEVMRRLRHRAREYPLTETKETIPFGRVRLRHLVILYGLLYVLWMVLSLVFYFQWVSGTSLPVSPEIPSTFLNL